MQYPDSAARALLLLLCATFACSVPCLDKIERANIRGQQYLKVSVFEIPDAEAGPQRLNLRTFNEALDEIAPATSPRSFLRSDDCKNKLGALRVPRNPPSGQELPRMNYQGRLTSAHLHYGLLLSRDCRQVGGFDFISAKALGGSRIIKPGAGQHGKQATVTSFDSEKIRSLAGLKVSIPAALRPLTPTVFTITYKPAIDELVFDADSLTRAAAGLVNPSPSQTHRWNAVLKDWLKRLETMQQAVPQAMQFIDNVFDGAVGLQYNRAELNTEVTNHLTTKQADLIRMFRRSRSNPIAAPSRPPTVITNPQQDLTQIRGLPTTLR